MTNKVEYDANTHGVNSVTVFQSNRAEVKRSIKVALKDGPNDIEIKNLPSCLDKDSIRVDGIGNAVILDVIYHTPPTYDSMQKTGAFDSFNDRQQEINEELAILRRQAETLKSYSKTLSGKDTTADHLHEFLNTYASRKRKINEASNKLNGELKLVEKEMAAARLSLNADEESIRLRGAKVVIVVLGQGDGEAELSLMYVVSNASWTPHYDLRATIAHSEKTSSTVNLHYRASITQCTGEDWSQVALVLSTASPLHGTTVPSLQPHWIGENEPWRSQPVQQAFIPPMPSGSPPVIIRTSTRRSRSSSRSPERLINHRSALIEQPSFDPPSFIPALQAVASEGTVSTTFSIPGFSNIPSDPLSSPQTHKVSITEIAFQTVDLEWVTVPKDIPSVFLRCKVKNTSEYVLLGGQTNVFMNNNFVAKSAVPHVNPQEMFSCSLGVDPAVRVTYHPQSKKTKTSGNLLSSKTSSTSYEQRISVKNTRMTSIPRLIIKHQVPVSRVDTVKVNITEPKELQPQGKVGTVTSKRTSIFKNGVTARWDVRDEDIAAKENAEGDPSLGLIEWICQVKPNENVEVNVAWEVRAPAGVKWVRS